MTKFIVDCEFDGRKFTVTVMAKTAQSAVNKAKRIWPCRKFFGAAVAA